MIRIHRGIGLVDKFRLRTAGRNADTPGRAGNAVTHKDVPAAVRIACDEIGSERHKCRIATVAA